MHSISKNLKKIRMDRGWTQQQMADVLFVTRQTVSNWENGKVMPDIDTLFRIAEKLDITVDELLYGTHKSDRKIRKDLLGSVIILAVGAAIYLLAYAVQYYPHMNPFNMLPGTLSRMYARPLILFAIGMMSCQLLKISNIIQRFKGLRYRKMIRFCITAFIALQLIIFIPHIINEFAFMISGDYTDITGMQSFIENNRWFANILMFYQKLQFSYGVVSALVYPVLGFISELVQPFNVSEESVPNPDFTQFKNAVKNPAQFAKNLKQSFSALGTKRRKQLMIQLCAFIALIILQIFALNITKENLWYNMLHNLLQYSVITPWMYFLSAVLICNILKTGGLVTDDGINRYHKVISVTALTFMAINFAVFIPHILREFMIIADNAGLITVTGTYDITGWVLTGPKWFDKILKWFWQLAENGGVKKVIFYFIPGVLYSLSDDKK